MRITTRPLDLTKIGLECGACIDGDKKEFNKANMRPPFYP